MCVCVCVCAYCKCVRTGTSVCAYVYVSVCLAVCMHAWAWVYMRVCTHCLYVCMDLPVCGCVRVCYVGFGIQKGMQKNTKD